MIAKIDPISKIDIITKIDGIAKIDINTYWISSNKSFDRSLSFASIHMMIS